MEMRSMGGLAMATIGLISTIALVRSLSQNEEEEEKTSLGAGTEENNTCTTTIQSNKQEQQQQQQQQPKDSLHDEFKGKQQEEEVCEKHGNKSDLSTLSFKEFDSLSPKRQTRADRSLSEALSSQEILVLEGVGGHSKKNRGPLMLQWEGYVFKPFQDAGGGGKRMRGELEADFYEKVNQLNHPIQSIIPKYFGVEELEDHSKFLVLQDLTYGMLKPCVLDLKMGRQSYDEHASPEKVAKEKAKYPPQEIVGFRFSGMRVYQPASDDYLESTREWCFGIKQDEIPDALERFFFDGKAVRLENVREVVNQLGEIAKILEVHPRWRMYGASILILYDGASPNSRDVVVKLIDFAHCYEIKDVGGKDYSFLHGVYFLLASLNEILDRSRRIGRRGSMTAITLKKQVEEDLEKKETKQEEEMEEDDEIDSLTDGEEELENGLENADKEKEIISPIRNKLSRRSLSMIDILEQGENSLSVLRTISERHNNESSSSFMQSPNKKKQHRKSPSQDYYGLSESKGSNAIRRRALDSSYSERLFLDANNIASSPQVGGAHRSVFQLNQGEIAKMEVNKQTFENELHFYEEIKSERDALERVVPSLLRVEGDEEFKSRILVLEDIRELVRKSTPFIEDLKFSPASKSKLERSNEVCVMDIKLGFRSYDLSTVSCEPKTGYYDKYVAIREFIGKEQTKQTWESIYEEEKKKEEETRGGEPKYIEETKKMSKKDYLMFRDATTTTSKFGMRLSATKHTLYSFSSEEARKITSVGGFIDALEKFVSSGPNDVNVELAHGFIEELQSILEAFNSSRIFPKYDFVNTSLLFVHFDGVPAVRWIDFGGATPIKTVDEEADKNGLYYGILQLRAAFEHVILRNQ